MSWLLCRWGSLSTRARYKALCATCGATSRWFPDIRGSLWGLVMVLVMAFYPYVYLMARSAFLTQGHRSIEAAQALGYSPVQAFFKVSLPLARPWIGAGLALVLMEVLADFGAIAVLTLIRSPRRCTSRGLTCST